MPLSNKRAILKKFIDIGSMGLPIDDFADIVFVNFAADIETHLRLLVNKHGFDSKQDVWMLLDELMDTDLDHPVLQDLYVEPFISALIGPEYTVFDRYPKVYEALFNSFTTHLNIAIIGCAYGHEIISVCNKLSTTAVPFYNLTAFNKPSPIFAKLQSTIRYPAAVLLEHVSETQLHNDFVRYSDDTLGFSPDFYRRVCFQNLDLLVVPTDFTLASRYDMVLVHNVLQYLVAETHESPIIFRNKVRSMFEWLQSLVNTGGMVSIINESCRPNAVVTEMQNAVFGDISRFTCRRVEPAGIYIKS